ncbi:MAG TPA: hypothetical protein PLJ27_17315 [Polyangiaceae bacterium]|jgi:hypothetical protein|nr:MAG: hypothetical protein BWY17_04995 [Deltaproteobacteria bacterium ADurb.Bin207]HNT00101.1 hypothetical protein [Polyangiaceae bacterium]HNZ24695.1 hypothetical protein [Polyangiaceae bacterium]HOD25469.1 hypothetical protein [Polyangiaceae bacterium]HOE51700.1 hypothetical protein [Polyangiaceae bacterium]
MIHPSPHPSRFPSYPEDTNDTGVRQRTIFFQSVADIDARVRTQRASLDGALLTVANGSRFVLRDALRVLGSSKGHDVFGMTGRIMPLSELLTMGATLSSSTLQIGNVHYEVQLGYLVQPLG